MRLSLPFLVCAIVASLHYSTEAERFSNSRYLLGRALLRRAREINETRSNGDELEDEVSEEERERILQTEAAEDIFVGSGNHVYESQGKSETSGSRRDETSGDEGKQVEESGNDEDGPNSGDSGEGDKSDDDESDDDDDDEEKSEDDDDDDGTETKKEQESSDDEVTSGSGLIENENAARRSEDVSGSGSGSAQQDDNLDQSGSAGSGVEALTPASASGDEASGVAVQSSENNVEETASRKSEIATVSGESEDEDDDSGSAEVIKKGIESLSRLLTPVASGYEFELYSGSAAKHDKEQESQAEGESEKGESSDAEEVHVKQCKRVCEDPMTYEQCAVPRCDYKMGTIKDLCIYLCKHQTPVCRQECE